MNNQLSELKKIVLGPKQHAFWDHTSGPNNTPGVTLKYIQCQEIWGKYILADAIAENDERRIRNIKQNAERGYYDKGKVSHPDFDWWRSIEAYDNGNVGFSGWTKDEIERNNPNMVIHPSKHEALKAAGY